MNALFRSLAMLCAIVLFGVCPLSGQENKWEPPIPDETGFVWIELPSGERLAGEVKSLRDQEFEFDSEELDNLSFDWDDIRYLKSPQIMTFEFEDRGNVTGTATISETTVFVRVGDDVREYPRSSLLSIISGAATEWNYWSANASIGWVGRSGNTDQLDINTTLFIRRQTTRTRIDIDYKSNFGKVSEVQTVNNNNLLGKFDYLITQGFFVTPASANLLTDKFQNIDLRTTFAAGLGYFITRKGNIEWSVGFGAGYQSTRFISVEPEADLTQHTGILVPNTLLDMDVTGSLELVAEYSAQMGLSDPKNTFHHSSIYFTLDAWNDILEFTLRVTWDHNTNPQPDENGVVPNKNDLRTAFGIGVDL